METARVYRGNIRAILWFIMGIIGFWVSGFSGNVRFRL